jgi:hypothetical protein
VTEGRIVACSYHTLHLFDADLEARRDLSHGLMVGLHEIALTGDVLWVASTAIDMALAYDLRSGDLVDSFAPREMPAFRSRWDLSPLEIDLRADNRARWLAYDAKTDPSHLHLNAIAISDGSVLALFNRFGAIVDLTSSRVLVEDPVLTGAHNLVVLDDGTLVSADTRGAGIRFYNAENGNLQHVVDLQSFGWVRRLRRSIRENSDQRLARPLFTRGLAFDGDVAAVGISPASVLLVDWREPELLDVYQHSSDVRHAIHGLAIAG